MVALMVRIDELPAVIEVGFAEILTVGAGGGGAWVTVTVAVADALVPPPVATAVYVVVAAGLTDSVPPFALSV